MSGLVNGNKLMSFFEVFFLKIYVYECFFLDGYLCAMYVFGSHGGQKRVINALSLSYREL